MNKFIVVLFFILLPYSAYGGGVEDIFKKVGNDILTGIVSGTTVECQHGPSGNCKGVVLRTGEVKPSGSIDVRVRGRRTLDIVDSQITGKIGRKTFCLPACPK